MNHYSRRDFIKNSALGVGGSLLFGSAVISAGIDSNTNLEQTQEKLTIPASFQHSVASGDPQQDAIILWTRVTPELSNKADQFTLLVPVVWEVALDENFDQIIRRGRTKTSFQRDFTVKIDAVGLRAGTQYYYRFITASAVSPVGKAKTLPESGVEQVKFAVMSCSNYPAGYFNAYAEAAKMQDLDAFIHLGDYIYEYEAGGFATENADAIGRGFLENNSGETLNLLDYRRRYGQYRTDAGLQALHASTACICVWDDHEVANDTWIGGAENHNEGEGDFESRKQMALRAYFEWMPIRPPVNNNREIIYRQFNFGNLVSLFMLDTRIVGRDQQLNFANYLSADGSFNSEQFIVDVTDANRTLLGAEQLGWLQASMLGSNATWQVFGQQVLMGRMTIPVELLFGLGNPSADTLSIFAELAQIKGRILAGDPTVTDQERQRVETVLPYNLDAWDGYAFEREVLFSTAAQADKNLVVLAGDTHNGWANNLRDLSGNPVGVEFATAGVTSPGLESFLSLPAGTETLAEQALETLIDDLQYHNISDRGFMVVTFTPEKTLSEWFYVNNILSTDYQLLENRTQTLQVKPGATGRVIESI